MKPAVRFLNSNKMNHHITMDYQYFTSSAVPRPPKSPSSSKQEVVLYPNRMSSLPPSISPVSTVQFGDDATFNCAEEMKIDESAELENFMYEALSPPLKFLDDDDDEEAKLHTPPRQHQRSITSTSSKFLPPRASAEEPALLQRRPDTISRCMSDPSVCSQHQQQKDKGEQAMILLADDCVNNRDIKTGIALYECVLKEQEKHSDLSPKIATTLQKLGKAYLLIGKFEVAAGFFQEATTIRATFHGPLNHGVADSLVHLGTAKLHTKHLDEAHDAFRRALRIHQQLFGIHHGNVGHIHTQLGCIHFHMGELMAAHASFEDALDVYQHLSRTDTTDTRETWMGATAEALCNIGSIKLSQRKYGRAIHYFRDALLVSVLFFRRTQKRWSNTLSLLSDTNTNIRFISSVYHCEP